VTPDPYLKGKVPTGWTLRTYEHPATRERSACLVAPDGRTYTYAWSDQAVAHDPMAVVWATEEWITASVSEWGAYEAGSWPGGVPKGAWPDGETGRLITPTHERVWQGGAEMTGKALRRTGTLAGPARRVDPPAVTRRIDLDDP
jgi:hypothetical protein